MIEIHLSYDFSPGSEQEAYGQWAEKAILSGLCGQDRTVNAPVKVSCRFPCFDGTRPQGSITPIRMCSYFWEQDEVISNGNT